MNPFVPLSAIWEIVIPDAAEDISDSDEQEPEIFITSQPADVSRTRPAVYFIGDPKDDDELVFAHVEVATQTDQALAETVGLPQPDIQQMLIDSQNLTIQLLCEKIDMLHFSRIGNILNPQAGPPLNPQADIFIPSCDFAPEDFTSAQPISLAELFEPSPLCLSELIPADPENLITEFEQLTAGPEGVVPTVEPMTPEAIEEEVLSDLAAGPECVVPTVETIRREAVEEVRSELQRVKAALANSEIIIEELKIEFSSGRSPDLLASKVVDQVFKKISACEPLNIVIPDAVWCLVPARRLCLQICEDNILLGFWDTLFFGTSLGRCAASEFPPIGLMVRKNPDSLVFHHCPGCACEITSDICYACAYASKNQFYIDGFRSYSLNSQDPIENNSLGPFSFSQEYDEEYELFSQLVGDGQEDYMLDHDPSSDIWS